MDPVLLLFLLFIGTTLLRFWLRILRWLDDRESSTWNSPD